MTNRSVVLVIRHLRRAATAGFAALALLVLLAVASPLAKDAGSPLADVLPQIQTASANTCLDSIDTSVRDGDTNANVNAYTNDRYIYVYTTRNVYYNGTGCSYTYPYWYLIVIAGGTHVTSSAACGEIRYIGYQPYMTLNGTGAAQFDYDTQACAGYGGHGTADGNKSGQTWLVRCTSGATGNTGGSVWYPWSYMNGSCIAGGYDGWIINKDTVAPVITSISPSSTRYSSAASGTVSWTVSETNSGIDNHEVAWQWSGLSGGTCTGYGAWSYGWSGAGTAWGPGWGTNQCFKYAVHARDRAYNYGAYAYSADIILDSQRPSVGGHLSAVPNSASVETCYSPGQTVYVTDGGSSDPAPTSGWPWGGGMWYYYHNGGSATGWISNNYYGYAVPTPAVGSQGNYNNHIYIRDNVGAYENAGTNQSDGLVLYYSVDNSRPINASLNALPAYTSSTSHNLGFSAAAGGCKGVDQVAISNNGSNWLYSNYITSFSGWDITNASYGGSTAQGARTVHVAFRERGTNNWTYVTSPFIYDITPPTATTSLSVGAADYGPGSITSTWSTADAHSGVNNAAHYYRTRPSIGGDCTGAISSWTPLSYATSGSYVLTTTHGLCYQWATDVIDRVGLGAYQTNGSSPGFSQWLLVDTSPPQWNGWINAPEEGAWVADDPFVFAWAQFTDDLSGYDDSEVRLQTASQLADGACGTFTSGPVIDTTATSYTVAAQNNYCYRVLVRAHDQTGNASAWQTSAAIRVDGTPPVTNATIISGTSGLNGWYVTPVTVKIDATDTHSGFNTTLPDLGVIKYRINGGSVQSCGFATCGQPDGDMTLLLDFPTDGIYTITYWAVDRAGNTEGTHTLTIKVDVSPPTGCVITAAEQTTETTVDVTLDGCIDDGGGLDGARFGDEVGYNWNDAYNNIGWIDYNGGSLTREVTLESGSGDYKILVQVRDQAGNMVFLDTTTTLSAAGSTDYPVFGAGAYIYECGESGDPEDVPDNSTGSIYWAIDRPLCLVPHAEQLVAGTRTSGAAPPDYAEEINNLNPIGYWRLGEASGSTAADSSGNGNDGVVAGTVDYGVPGLLSEDANTAYGLDGSGAQITTTISGLPTHSAAIWFRRDGDNSVGYHHLFQNLMGLSGELYVHNLGYILYQGIAADGVTTVNYFPGGTTYRPFATTGSMHFLVATYDGSTMRVYVDGAEVGTGLATNLSSGAVVPMIIGRTANYYPLGVFDEPAVFDRVLTPAEIATLYGAGTPFDGALTSRVINPVVDYTLLENPNDPARSGLSYPVVAVGETRQPPPDDLPLQFGFRRETSGMAAALPVIIIPVEISTEIGWFDSSGNQIGPSELLVTRVEARVVVRNTGRTPSR